MGSYKIGDSVVSCSPSVAAVLHKHGHKHGHKQTNAACTHIQHCNLLMVLETSKRYIQDDDSPEAMVDLIENLCLGGNEGGRCGR